MRYLSIVFLIVGMISLYGCAKKGETIKDLEKHPGLSVVPYYPKDYAFHTGGALERLRKRERMEKLAVIEELKRRFKKKRKERPSLVSIPDPWLPPERLSPSDLPLALRFLPKDYFGYPDWEEARRRGLIAPRGNIGLEEEKGEKKEELDFNEDIVFVINDRFMADVLFSHKVHNYWLSCKNCHPSPFKDSKGANQFNMYDIWEGKYCGKCHGKVAFMAKGFENCQRCHKVKKGKVRLERPKE